MKNPILDATPARSPSLEKQHAAARARILEACRKLSTFAALSLDNLDLRFVIEMQMLMLEALIHTLTERGIVVPCSFAELDLAYVETRAVQLESRVQAWLDGNKEMPR